MAKSPVIISGIGRKVFCSLVLFLLKKDVHTVGVWLFAASCIAFLEQHYGWAIGLGLAFIASSCVSASEA